MDEFYYEDTVLAAYLSKSFCDSKTGEEIKLTDRK